MSGTGFGWILLGMAMYGALHSVLASLTFKAWVERVVGSGVYRRFYRAFFSLMAAVSLLPVLAGVLLLPDRMLYTIPLPWVFLTAGLQLASGWFLLVGVLQTGGMRFLGLAQMVNPEEGNRILPLVTDGLYHYMRHPLYTFSLLFIWLFPLMSWNILAFNLGVTIYLLVGIQLEERKLLAEFGETYAEYRRRTAMLIPRVGRR